MKYFLLGLASLAFAAPSFADVRLSSTVQEEVVTMTKQGVREVKLTPADHVAPGDVVIIRIAYTNDGDKPAANVVISNPVPQHLSLIDIREGGEAECSVDGGKTFGALQDLTVTQDGATRAARSADVTHVRWRLTSALAPGASGAVAFAARLD